MSIYPYRSDGQASTAVHLPADGRRRRLPLSIRIVPYSPESTINLVPHTDTETERSADKPR